MVSSDESIAAVSRPSDGWKERIIVPTILAGFLGGAFGLASKSRRALVLNYATNFAIVAGFYSGARELARDARNAENDDLMNSFVGGLASGAMLGRFQGGQVGAIKYAVVFALAGTAIDFGTLRLRPHMQRFRENFTRDEISNWLILPEWSPIQVLDEEALAAKKEREKQLIRAFRELKEKS